jgi:hypothetical protein
MHAQLYTRLAPGNFKGHLVVGPDISSFRASAGSLAPTRSLLLTGLDTLLKSVQSKLIKALKSSHAGQPDKLTSTWPSRTTFAHLAAKPEGAVPCKGQEGSAKERRVVL